MTNLFRKWYRRWYDWWYQDVIALEQRVGSLNTMLEMYSDANKEEIERLHLALAACGVATMMNTPESTKARLTKNSPYYSASYADVCSMVDREIQLRNRVEYLETTLGYRNSDLEWPLNAKSST